LKGRFCLQSKGKRPAAFDNPLHEDLQKAAGLFFNHGQTAEHQEMIALIKKLQQG